MQATASDQMILSFLVKSFLPFFSTASRNVCVLLQPLKHRRTSAVEKRVNTTWLLLCRRRFEKGTCKMKCVQPRNAQLRRRLLANTKETMFTCTQLTQAVFFFQRCHLANGVEPVLLTRIQNWRVRAQKVNPAFLVRWRPSFAQFLTAKSREKKRLNKLVTS